MTYFKLISSELVNEFKISFLTKAFFVTSDTHLRNLRFIADVTAEIFEIKNGSVGNLLVYIYK